LNYALYRPIPPKSLIEEIVSNVACKDLAVDVGCGSGQSTRVLSPYFERVVGIDVSSAQIANASKNTQNSSNTNFVVGPGDSKLPFEDKSVDLVTCCQAIHWFDISKFYQEVDRVLKPQKGVLAVIGYHLTGPSPNLPAATRLDELRDKVFNDITGKYWSPERRLVDGAYRTIPLPPYPEVQRSDSHYSEITEASLQDFAGYIETWSGFQKYKEIHGDASAEAVISEFLSESKKALKVAEETNSSQISLALRTRYFMILARKGCSC